VLGLDFLLLAAVKVGDEPDQAGIALGPRFEGARAQAAGKSRGQHADADLPDDFPDAVDISLPAHAGLTSKHAGGSCPRGGAAEVSQ
jgi:hypothetical protein